MDRERFGQVLSRFVPLTADNVREILHDQSATRRRFGQIALDRGLCKPHHVWRAWWSQLSGAPERIDLPALGIDPTCIAHLPRALAVEFNVIPIGASGRQLVLAAAEGSLLRAMEELPRRLKFQLKFVLAAATQIRQAIETHYPCHGQATADIALSA